MERNSDASRTALLTYSHAISSHQNSKHESLPSGCLLGLCLNLKQPSPEGYSCNSPYSCSLNPQASFTPTVVSVVSVVFVVLNSISRIGIFVIRTISVRLNPKQQSRVRLLIRAIRVIRVRHLKHSSPQTIRSVQPIKH